MSTKRSGMGLGLSICRGMVEAHGGQLCSEPNPIDGTIFRFSLAAVPGRDKEIPDELIVHATDRLGSKTAVGRRWGARPESLRAFGRLPGTGVMRCAEPGVRKASAEETAEGVRRRSTNAEDCPISVIARPSRTVSDGESEMRTPVYLSSRTSSNRQPLKTLLTTRLRPLTRGRQQVAARV